jgi:transcriptional regulator
MAKNAESGVVQGTLEMLILKTVALESMHSYGIGTRLTQISRGAIQVNPGSLFPALRRLERDGFIEGAWRTTEYNRRGKFYALTASGQARLREQSREWGAQVSAIARILRASAADL